MADEGNSEIRQFLIEMAKEADAPQPAPREDLIAEINGYLDELETFGIRRERFDFGNIPESYLPTLLDAVWEQLKQRKRFLGVS
jgi:hypothetical protein